MHIAPYLPSAEQRWIVGALCAIVLTWQFGRVALSAGQRAAHVATAYVSSRPIEDLLTVVAASIATGVSATGMWRFSGDVLGLDGPLRLLLFAFIEVAIITSAVRARRNMRENFSAGIDGIAVWALTCLTAVLSSMDARSAPEALFRLAAPLVAAWLWERGMAIERHRIRGTGRINWRLTPERVLMWLGLAEASDRTAGEVDAQRRLTRVALAIKRVKALRASGASERKLRGALAKLDKAMDQAVAHARLAVDETRQEALLAQIDALYSTDALVKRQKVAKWADPTTQEDRERAEAALDEALRFDTAEATQRAIDKTAITLMALTELVTSPVTYPEVTDRVNRSVLKGAVPAPRQTSAATPSLINPVTPSVTVEQVNDKVTFDITDPTVFDLEQMLAAEPVVTPALTRSVTYPEVTREVTEDAADATKTKVMRAFWENEIAQKRYPRPIDLARHANADRSLARRLRADWVEELSGWAKRRAKAALRDKASA
ncbi:hypothetical protein AB0F17_08120 [Nonomuraea sp. NPDC026600]|uniref:hypothetical protein n=1 Tax=Nonomuraea sp. NPDC026600 TaxID=3155363 RepID=UPI0034051927